jgi:pilus assembly protein Flp/PilA
MTKMFKKLAGDRSGATAIEYGLIAALIAIAIAGAATNVGNSLKTKFTTVATALN